MVAASYEYQQKALFHIGMTSNAAYWAEDLAVALESLNNFTSNTILDYFKRMIDELDDLWERLRGDSSQRFSYKEQVAGDINRAVTRDDPRSILRDWKNLYMDRVDELCMTYGLPNYRDPAARAKYLRVSGSFINSIPGPADTAVSSRIAEWCELGSTGFGVMIA